MKERDRVSEEREWGEWGERDGERKTARNERERETARNERERRERDE